MKTYSLNQLYQTIDISKQAVHQFEKKQNTFDAKLYELLTQADLLRGEHSGCGIEKMYHSLQPDFIGRDRFIELMMEFGYRVRKPKNFIKTTIPASYRYPNLIEGAAINHINRIWQTDITYIHIADRFYYLIFIMDVYSRRILGFSAADHMRAEANINCLKQSFRIRKGHLLYYLVHHSDRGSQYISKIYTDLLSSNNIQISMGLSAMENAFAERVNGIIKNEYLNLWKITSFSELRKRLKQAVEHYNHKRIHNSLPGRISPSQFEDKLKIKTEKAHLLIYSLNNENMKELKKQYTTFDKNTSNWHCPILTKHDI